MSKQYQQAIRNLTAGNYSADDVVRELAMRNPSIFNAIVSELNKPTAQSLTEKVYVLPKWVSAMRDWNKKSDGSSKVNAIKEMRMHFDGLDLRAAKHTAEAIQLLEKYGREDFDAHDAAERNIMDAYFDALKKVAV